MILVSYPPTSRTFDVIAEQLDCPGGAVGIAPGRKDDDLSDLEDLDDWEDEEDEDKKDDLFADEEDVLKC